MAGGRIARLLFPSAPKSALGRPLPKRFRDWRIHFVSPPRLVSRLVEWIEQEAGQDGRPAAEDDRVAREREALRDVCIELCDPDLVRSDSLRRRIRSALHEAGVTEIEGGGEAFDPDKHQAVERVETADADLHNRIAGTERPGYADHGRPIRLPEVRVYRLRDS